MNHARLTEFRRWFADYCRSFYTDNEEDNRNIRLKEEHTHRVCANMELLAESLSLGDADRFLAETVALFHDVGRFEQYRRFRTFKDSVSVNHAALGERVLAEERVLDPLPEEERRLVTRAIALHNVFRVPDNLDERSLLFLKLVRDADKLDIWRVFIDFFHAPEGDRASAAGLGFPDLPGCSPGVLATVAAGRMVQLSSLKCLNDFKLLQLSWIYDINFGTTLRLVRERGVLAQFSAMLPKDRAVVQVLQQVREYLERKLTSTEIGAALW